MYQVSGTQARKLKHLLVCLFCTKMFFFSHWLKKKMLSFFVSPCSLLPKWLQWLYNGLLHSHSLVCSWTFTIRVLFLHAVRITFLLFKNLTSGYPLAAVRLAIIPFLQHIPAAKYLPHLSEKSVLSLAILPVPVHIFVSWLMWCFQPVRLFLPSVSLELLHWSSSFDGSFVIFVDSDICSELSAPPHYKW